VVTRAEAAFGAGFVGLLLGLALATHGAIAEFVPKLLSGFGVTVSLSIAAAIASVVLAFVAGLAKVSSFRLVRWTAVVYAELFRGTSLLVQLFWLYYVLPHFGIFLEPFTVGVLAIALNFGAYGSEVVRGAVKAVPRGQWEAVVALNLGYFDAMRRIILPQAIPAMIPPYGNLMIQLLKATALVSLISIADLTFEAYQLDQFTGETLKIFAIVLAAYFALALCWSIGFQLFERWLKAALGRSG
jgi:polar amino acid transport system permease protein